MKEFYRVYLQGYIGATVSFLLTVLSICGAIATGGVVRIVVIIASILFGLWFAIHVWRFLKMLRAWIDLLREQHKVPQASLFLIINNLILLPKPSWKEKSHPTLYIEFEIVSCLLKEIELSNAKLEVQIPGITGADTGLEIPIQGTNKIKRLGVTEIKVPEFSLLPNMVEDIEKLYRGLGHSSRQTRIGFTVQLMGFISKEQTELKEITRARHTTTAWIH